MAKRIHPKVCQNELCKKPFIGYIHQKFCSYECYRKSYSKIRYPTEKQEITCLWCHTIFKNSRYNKSQLYCCHECGAEFNRAKHSIETRYFFEHEKQREEYERLKVLGKNYKIEAIN